MFQINVRPTNKRRASKQASRVSIIISISYCWLAHLQVLRSQPANQRTQQPDIQYKLPKHFHYIKSVHSWNALAVTMGEHTRGFVQYVCSIMAACTDQAQADSMTRRTMSFIGMAITLLKHNKHRPRIGSQLLWVRDQFQQMQGYLKLLRNKRNY